MRKLKLFLSLLMLISFSVGTVWAAETKLATLDFTTNTAWGFPVGSGNGITEATDYSDGTYTINVSATTKYYFNNNGYLMIGKNGSQLKLPAFTWKTTKIVVTGNSGASADTKQNIYVGTTAVSTETTSSKTTQTYNIASAYQAAGNVYIFQVCSNHNAQVTKIEVYGEAEAPKPTVSSIAVKTAPTKVTYTEGESFDPTGLVITATYSDASTSDVAYKDNEDKFSFSPALNEALETTDAQVTITYGEKSANQAITVNAAAPCTSEITITKGTPEHGSFDLTGAGTVCIDGGNASATVSNIEAADGYRFKEITTDAGTVDGMDITDIDANTTINVVFEEIPSHKVYFYNGATLLNEGGTDVKEGAAVAYSGSTPESCDSGEGASTNFAGWATDVWDGKVAKANIVPDFYDGALPVMGENDVTYYAVFCKGGNAVGGITQEEITTAVNADEGTQGQYADRTYPSASGNWTGTFAYNEQNNQKVMQINASSGNGIISPTFEGSISNVEITYSNGSSSSRSFYIKNGENNLGTISADGSGKGKTASTNISGSYTSFTITASAALYIHSIRVTYGTEASNYMTSCCEKHTITVDNEIEHGSVSASLAEACENTKVKLTPTPAAHCQFVSWNVKDEDEGSIDVAADSTFTMPDKDVTVSATFAEIKNAVTFATPTGGTLVVKHNDATVSTGDLIKEGETVKLVYAADAVNHYIGGTVSVKDASNADVDVAADSTFVMPGKAVTISVSYTATYAINIVADGGNVALDYTPGGAADGYAIAGTEIMATATADDAHEFTSLALSENVTSPTIDANIAMFTMPAEAVTITATFAVKTTPTIGVSTDIIEFAPVDYKGALVAQTFNVSGAALAAGKLSISCDNAAFTVSPAEIDVDGALAATEVTVTPKTTSCGTFDGTITISGGGAADKQVLVSLTVNKLAHGLEFSANEATVTINGDDNVFPTLSNPHKLQIELSSEDDAIATFDEGHIVLVAPGTVKIYANTVGSNDTVALPAENAVFYTLTVQKKYTAKWIVNGDTENPIKTQSAVAGTDLEIPSNPTKLADDCEELVFVGWGGKNVAGVQEMVNTTGLKMPEKDTTFYAVFATPQPSDPVKVTDNIDNAFTGVSGNSYVDWSGKAGTSGAVYAGNSAGDYTTVQLRSKNSNSGVVTTATGSGKLSKVTITWNDNTSAARIVDIYGKTTAYEAATDLYASATQGTKLGSLNIDDATDGVSTLVVEGDYTCVGIRSNNSALYLDNIAIEWTTPGSTTYSDSVTVCPTCTTVALTKGATSNGSFQFQVGGEEVSSVKTCEAANVDVVFSPAEGYELSAFTITGVDGAKYDEGVISIPQDATGTLIATAEFGLENHKVTMAQTGGASASISADQNNKHAGDEITVTANDVDGYYFIGWAASPEVSFANAKALSTTFTMPSSDVTVTAKYTKILTVAEAIAKYIESGNTSDVVVEGYVSSFYSSSVSSGQISYFIQDKDENGFLTGTEFEAYKGKGLNGADFAALNDIAIGDKVRIFGNLRKYNSTYELDENNYLLAQTVKGEVTSVEVYGTASKTEYFNNDDFEFTGLKAKQVFENGYAEEIASPAWAASPAKVTVSGNVAVTATYNEKTSAPYNVAVTKVLREPTLSWSEETPVYLVGQENTFPTVNNPKSLPLTYESSAPAVADIDENGEVTLHTAGATTLKFSFAGDDEYAAKQNVEYNLVVYDLESVSVNGTANVTAYEAGSAFVRTGLTAQANYKSGELTTNFNITEDKTVVWSCDPATVDAGTSKVTVSATWNGKTGTKDVSVAILTHTVKFADPEHGSLVVKNAGTQIASGDEFANGTVLTVEANPDPEEDYYLAALTVNETDIKAEKEFTVGLLTDYTVVATFAERTVAPISWGEASESIALNGDVATLQALTNDEDLTVVYSSDNTDAAMVDPATGAITLEGVGSAKISAKYTATTEGQYKTTTVTYTLNVTAATYAVTFDAPTNGTLVILNGSESITSGDEFVKGTELDVVAAPASGYLLATLTANGEDIKSSAKVIIGTADVVVVATFEKDATALDNTEASEKVVKTMENGVLIIRRGDKTYNGQGQLLK